MRVEAGAGGTGQAGAHGGWTGERAGELGQGAGNRAMAAGHKGCTGCLLGFGFELRLGWGLDHGLD